MPKKLDPAKHPEKSFQPIEKAFLNAVLDEAPVEDAPAQAAAEPTARSTPGRRAAARRRQNERDPAAGPRANVVDLPVRNDPEPEPERMEEEARELLASPERFTRVLKAKISSSEEAELSRMVNQLKRELDTPVSTTHVLRALVTILRHSENTVMKRARQNGPMRRPSNEDLTGIAAFEFRLAKLLAAAFRDAPPLKELPRE